MFNGQEATCQDDEDYYENIVGQSKNSFLTGEIRWNKKGRLTKSKVLTWFYVKSFVWLDHCRKNSPLQILNQNLQPPQPKLEPVPSLSSNAAEGICAAMITTKITTLVRFSTFS